MLPQQIWKKVHAVCMDNALPRLLALEHSFHIVQHNQLTSAILEGACTDSTAAGAAAFVYYCVDQGKDLSPFFASTAGYFKTELVQSWDTALRQRREKRLAAAAAEAAAAEN
jgi:hypothetical protein